MKKIFIYEQRLMNGTVTIGSHVSAFATRKLAEETREDIRECNSKRDLVEFSDWYGDIEEISVYESKEEIPFYKQNEK